MATYQEEKIKTAKEEAEEYNIFEEFNAIGKFIKERGIKNKYEQARYKILQYIINCIKADPEKGNYHNKENDKNIIEAGKLLYEFDGMDGMRDMLVWSFIPKRYHSEINLFWSGIGHF